MTLRGSLEAFPLETVLQLLAATGKTGELEVRDDGRSAMLAMSGGRLVSARYEDEPGEIALGAAFTIRAGDFEFVPMDRAGDEDLTGDLNELLDAAVEHRDRLVSVGELIPHDRVRFRLSERAADRAEIRLAPDEWRALLAVEGQGDIDAIASRLGLRRLAARELLARLIQSGLIDVVRPLPAEEGATAAERSAPPMRPLAPTRSGEPVTLHGSLPDLPLDAVLRLCEATGPTGRLDVRGRRETFRLGFDRGRLVSAEWDGETGDTALAGALAVEGGEFDFVPTATAPERDLEGELEEILARAGSDRDRIVADRLLVPSDRVRFRLSERAAAGPAITLTPDQWRALLAVDGQRDLTALSAHLGLRPLATLGLFADLARRGAVDTIEPPPEVAPEREPVAEMPVAEEVAEAPAWEPAEEVSAEPMAAEPELAAAPEVAETDDRLAALGLAGAPPAAEEGPAVDPRLALLSAPGAGPVTLPPPVELVAPPAPVREAEAAPAVAEQPPAAPAAPPAPAAPKVRGGLFGRFGKAEPAPPAPTMAPARARAAQLARFANELVAAYNSGGYGKARIEDRMRSWVMRVDEQADPIDRPVPLIGDRLDVTELEREPIPERQSVPYLAVLVREIHSEAERVLGKDKAKRGFRDTRERLFGQDLSLLQSSDVAGRIPKV